MKPSRAQIATMLAMQSGKSLARFDTSDDRQPWYTLDGKRINVETMKVLYCRGWVARSTTGKIAPGEYMTLYELTEEGKRVLGEQFAIGKKRLSFNKLIPPIGG
jgi:hypothetical protein